MNKIKGYIIIEEKIDEPYFIVEICGDCDDADYEIVAKELDTETFEEYALPLIQYLFRECWGYRRLKNIKEYFQYKDIDYIVLENQVFHDSTVYMEELLGIPMDDDYDYCHTLHYINIEYYDENNKKYKVRVKGEDYE